MNNKKGKHLSTRKMAIIGVLGGISMLLGVTPLGFIPVGPTNATIMHIPVIIGAIIEGPIVGAMVGFIFGVFSLIRAFTAPTVISPVFYNPMVSILPRVLIGVVAYYSYALFKGLGRKVSITTLSALWGGTLLYLIYTFMNQLKSYQLEEVKLVSLILTLILVFFTIIIGVLSYKKLKDQAVEVVISAALGTLTNTIGVLGMVYIFYGRWFVEKIGGDITKVGKVIMGVGIANGIPEIIVAMLVVSSVVMTLRRKG